jgi:hypothetical protein
MRSTQGPCPPRSWYPWTSDAYHQTPLIPKAVGIHGGRGSHLWACFVQHEEKGALNMAERPDAYHGYQVEANAEG